MEAVKAFEPSGVLLVKLKSAENLAKKGGLSGGLRSLVGQDKPDPYAKIRLGASVFENSVVKNEQNPDWSDEKAVPFLLDTIQGHQLRIDFYDQDSFSQDDFLGKIVKKTDDLANFEPLEEVFELQDDEAENDSSKPTEISGQASVDLQILPVSQEMPENPRFYIVNIFVYSFNNLVFDMESEIYPTTRNGL